MAEIWYHHALLVRQYRRTFLKYLGLALAAGFAAGVITGWLF